jgi:hypothetical protein
MRKLILETFVIVVDNKIKEHKGYIEDISVWNVKKELAEKIEVKIS